MSQGTFTIKESKDVNINSLKLMIQDKIDESLEWYRFNSITDTNGLGKFWRSTNLNYVIAAYYHPTKKHYAIADGGINGGGLAKCYANAGEWAIAYSRRGVLSTAIHALYDYEV